MLLKVANVLQLYAEQGMTSDTYSHCSVPGYVLLAQFLAEAHLRTGLPLNGNNQRFQSFIFSFN